MEKKICKKCGNEFEPTKGLINYCTLRCRNSRTWSEEDKKKRSLSVKNSEKFKVGMLRKKFIYLTSTPKNKIKKIRKIIKKVSEKKIYDRKTEIMEADFNTLKYERLRERIKYEQNGKCIKCSLDKWQDVPIPLELEHKDGDNKNNERENLEMLCPNCHAQTSTWRGRNKFNNNKFKINDEQLLTTLVENDWNMYKSLIEVNLSPKGGNYKRCHRLKKAFEEIVRLEGTAPSSTL